MERTHQPRPATPNKVGPTFDPAHLQREAAEVESARLLANDAAESLEQDGFTGPEIRLLADAYIALDIGEGRRVHRMGG